MNYRKEMRVIYKAELNTNFQHQEVSKEKLKIWELLMKICI